MFVSDLRSEFYNRLIGKRTLVIVNYDVDAICASKILQFLFKYDNILYSIVPIMGVNGLMRAFNENAEDVKNVILVNCGGCIDIVDVLQPEPDVVFYVCDSHRPYDVCNIYSENQVQILGDRFDGIPNFEDIFRDDEDEDQDELEYTNHEEFLRKRREREHWEKNREKIMFEYTEYSSYGQSSALRVFELAWRLTKDSIDLLWWAIVGVTEQLVLSKTEHSAYALDIDNIQTHVSRLTHSVTDNQIQMAVKINFENDLHLAMYRHWSIYDSLKNSIYPACKLKLWTFKGEKLMHELLVDIGLPLVQAKQTFQSMDLVLRKEFHSKIEKFSEKYSLSDIVFGSFTLQYGYRNKYSASDYVYAMLGILESVKKDRTPETCFLEALDCLSRSHKDLLDDGIEKCKTMLQAIYKQAQSAVEMHQIHQVRRFLVVLRIFKLILPILLGWPISVLCATRGEPIH
jgi:cell division control protein 45